MGRTCRGGLRDAPGRHRQRSDCHVGVFGVVPHAGSRSWLPGRTALRPSLPSHAPKQRRCNRFPGEPGRSHNHSYVGNFSVDASTQPGALLGGRTSCDFDADSSAYWAPTLFVGRRSVLPLAGFAYYVKRTSSDVVAHPGGLKMIAGNAAALRPQSTSIAAWSCGELGGGRKFATIPACARNHLLQAQITFPNCWQGTTLDSPNHKLHMAYASAGRCPASHPIALPTLVLILLYPEVPVQAQVASGRFGIHADFMNGWNQEILARLVTALNRES
jgi:Domain of unknown function (DUF1996)